MESLYFLVPCALIFIAIAVKVLFWAINNGQYDNLDTEAHRILFDDEKNKSRTASQESPHSDSFRESIPQSKRESTSQSKQESDQNTHGGTHK
jgi:cbb3-type cytochrome oxidase maturation protein